MKKVLAIIRASTERQETESQKKELTEYLSQYGFSKESIITLEVAGASARKKNPKYLQMLEDIKNTILTNKDIKAVGLWNLDRLGRVDDSLIEMKNWFINQKIQLYCKSPSLTLLNEDGTVNGGAEIAFGVFASLIKQQTEDLFNKFNRGKDRNRQQGRFNGGKMKFGYTVDKDGYFIINPEEKQVLDTIYKEYSTGKYSYVKLANELDSRGITKRGHKITALALHKLLKDLSYIGKGEYSKFPPIIDESLFNKVKNIREHNEKQHTKESSGRVHLGLKILKCSCGNNYIASNKYYTCYAAATKYRQLDPTKICDSNIYIPIDLMDRLLWYVSTWNYVDYNMKLSKVSVKDKKEQSKVLTLKINKLQQDIDKCVQRSDRNNQLYIDGDLTDKQYTFNKVKIESDKARFNKEIEVYKADLNTLENEIFALKMDDSKSYDVAFNDIKNADDKKKYEIVHKFVKQATLEREAMFTLVIKIELFNGEVITWKYYSRSEGKLYRYCKEYDIWYREIWDESDLKYYNEMDDSKLIELKDKKCIGAQIVYGQRYPNKADKKLKFVDYFKWQSILDYHFLLYY